MRWIGMVLGGLLLGALVYIAVLPDAERGRIVRMTAVPAPVGLEERRAAHGSHAPQAGTGSDAAPVHAPDAGERQQPAGTARARAIGNSPPPGLQADGTAANGPAGTPAPLPSGLVVPVQGIAPSALSPTFDDDRGEGRVHEALDIMAPTGTPVVAVADGHVEKLFDSDRGGLTIYQFEPTGRYAYYYAHLERYAPGLEEGQALRQGEVIGHVGSTGNADPAAPHLHFAIFRLGPEQRWWEGTPVDPWPLLSGRGP